jgi:hypothetical protein
MVIEFLSCLNYRTYESFILLGALRNNAEFAVDLSTFVLLYYLAWTISTFDLISFVPTLLLLLLHLFKEVSFYWICRLPLFSCNAWNLQMARRLEQILQSTLNHCNDMRKWKDIDVSLQLSQMNATNCSVWQALEKSLKDICSSLMVDLNWK